MKYWIVLLMAIAAIIILVPRGKDQAQQALEPMPPLPKEGPAKLEPAPAAVEANGDLPEIGCPEIKLKQFHMGGTGNSSADFSFKGKAEDCQVLAEKAFMEVANEKLKLEFDEKEGSCVTMLPFGKKFAYSFGFEPIEGGCMKATLYLDEIDETGRFTEGDPD